MKIYRRIQQTFETLAAQFAEFSQLQEQADNAAQRDIRMGDLYWAVDDLLWETDQGYLRDLYMGSDGQPYAIYIDMGKLYRAPVVLGSGDQPFLGTAQQVVETFVPVTQAKRTVVTRAADGKYHALAILSTSILNKDGEIDSTALYDDFISRFEGGERVNFHHFNIEFGTLRTIWRSGYVLWGHIEFDDNDLGRASAQTLAKDDTGAWGISIEFYPDEDGVELIDVSGIEIPVYNAGKLSRASVLKAGKAAAWFTALPATIQRNQQTMNKAIKQDFEELVGADLAAIAEGMDDTINNRAVSENMIRRESNTESNDEPDQAEVVADNTTDEGDQDVVIVDDSLVNVLAARLGESDLMSGIHSAIGAIESNVAEVIASMTALTEQLTSGLQQAEARNAELTQRLAAVEGGQSEAATLYALSQPQSKTYVYKPNQPANSEAATVDNDSLGARANARLTELQSRRGNK